MTHVLATIQVGYGAAKKSIDPDDVTKLEHYLKSSRRGTTLPWMQMTIV